MLRAALVFAATLILAIVGTTSPASALTPAEERAGARAAAERGADAFDAEKYEEAIDYFKRAEDLIHAPPHLLYIARAHEALGNLVAARETYLKIDRENLAADAPRAFVDAQQMAREELEELEARIPHVSVVVQGGGDQPVEVVRNGSTMPSALVGIPQPMDPGEHSFQARAPGAESAVQKVTVTEGSEETVLLTLRPKSGASSSKTDTSKDSATPTDSGTKNPWSGMKIAGYSSLGLGVVGAAVGTVFVLQASDSRGQAEQLFESCNPGCTDAQEETILALDSDAGMQTGVGIAGLTVGGVALATGVTLLILDGKQEPDTTQASIRPVFGFGTVGVAGRF